MRGVPGAAAFAFAAAVAVITALPLPAASQDAAEELPDFPGREDAFGYCSACHSFRVVARQGMNRARWDETLNWMTEKHAMPPPDEETRKVILDYLAAAYPAAAGSPRGSFVSPFAPK